MKKESNQNKKYFYSIKAYNDPDLHLDLIFLDNIEALNEKEAIVKAKQLVTREVYVVTEIKDYES